MPTEIEYPTTYNRELVFDLTLGAFFMYDFGHEEEDANAPRLHDHVPISKIVKTRVQAGVLDSNGDVVVDSNNNVTTQELITENRSRESRRESFKFLVTQGTYITLAEFKDYDFKDYRSYVIGGFDFDSFLLTGYDIGGDFMRHKQAIYLLVMCSRTETIWSEITSGEIIPYRPSSCKVRARWGWHNSDAQGKWGNEFQAYRLFLPKATSPSSGDTFDYGPTVIETKNKLRGRGKALSLYFNSESGKDLILLGWGILGYKNDEP